MATALEKNKGLIERFSNEVEQIKATGGIDPNQPGEPVHEEPSLTEDAPKSTTVPKTGDEADVERDLSYWKQRALTAEGRYNTLKPKLDDTIHKLRVKSAEQEAKIKELTQKVSSLKPDPVKAKLMDQQVQDVLGEETTTAILDSLEAIKADVNQKVEEANKVTKKVESTTQYDNFVSGVRLSLREFYPDVSLESINTDPGFASFLDGKRSPRGVPYRTLFNDSVGGLDVDSVAGFFLQYMDTVSSHKQEQQKDKDTFEVKDSVKSRTVPKTISGSSTVPKSSEGPRVTTAFIDKFKQDVARGYYRNRHSEMVETQKEIERAYMENRITK